MSMSLSTSPISATTVEFLVRKKLDGLHRSPTPLGENLVQAGLLTTGDLEAALTQHSSRQSQLGETLLEMGFVEEDTLLLFLGQQLAVPSVRLRSGLVDPNIVRKIPRSKADAFSVLALFCVRGRLTVAMAEPNNLRQLDELERITGMPIRPVLAMRSAIDRMLPHCYEENFSVVEAGQQSTLVRYRVDGHLREVLRPRREYHPAMVSRIKVLAKLDISEHRMPQDGRVHLTVDGREIDLRISTLPTILGEKVVMRVLDRKNVTFYLDKLGMPDGALAKTKGLLKRPYGLILTTGPTGSGKTTTLYSAVELIKSIKRNIVTVEDPVEYQLDLINQVQVSSTKTMKFSDALRSILRQDPDVIMVGEIRDAETAAISIQAALTGHLVLSTLHTNDSFSAVTRLLDMGIEPFKLSAALLGVIAQRLVRTICPACKTHYYPPQEQLDAIQYKGDRRRQFTHGMGCRDCYDTGFRGRTGIYEVFAIDRFVRDLISSNASVDALRSYHRQQGCGSLLDEGIRLAESGKTSLDEIIEVAYSE